MGLDQYLTAEVSLGGYNWSPEHERLDAETIVQATNLDHVWSDMARRVEVRVHVAYWRKANAIHRWFVENCQGGVDDCGTYPVTKADLRRLHETCVIVLASSEMVPDMVTRGFKSPAGADALMTLLGEFEAQRAMAAGEPRPEDAPTWERIATPGEVILDPAVAQAHLPVQPGPFFGSYEYDEGYVSDLVDTVAQIEPLLGLPDDTDLYYSSSW